MADEWERINGKGNQHVPPLEATRLGYVLPRGTGHPVVHRREGAWVSIAHNALVRSCD